MTPAVLTLILLSFTAFGLLVCWLVAFVVQGIARGLPPRAPEPVALPIDPGQARWTAMDDQQLARFLGDSTS